MIPSRRIAAAAVSLVAIASLAACSSDSSSSESGSPAASSGASAAEPAPESSPAAADDSGAAAAAGGELQWCTDYLSITNTLATAAPDEAGAAEALDALDAFDTLWDAAADRGYLTAEEVDASHRAIDAYRGIATMVSEGKAIDSPEVTAAQDDLVTLTTDDEALLNSSTQKIDALCSPVFATAAPNIAPDEPGPPSPAAS